MILTATNRLARELTQEYERELEAAGHRTWRTAPIASLNAWLSKLWTDWLYSGHIEATGRPLRPVEEQVVWEDIIRLEANRLPLDVPATAELALASWKLVCDGRLPLDAVEWTDSVDSVAFHSWAREFHRRCREHGWFSGAELPATVADLIEQEQVAVPSQVEIAGFHEPTATQQRLFDALERCGTKVQERRWPDLRESALRLGLADTSREIRAAAQWTRRVLEEEPEAAHPQFRIGIVVPDLYRLRSHIERVFGEEFHPRTRLRPDLDPRRLFNISLGLPASKYPIIGSAFLILETNPKEIPIEIASRLVRSPFLPGAEEEWTKRALLDVALRSKGEYHVSLVNIIKLAGKADAANGCPTLVAQLRHWNTQYEALVAEGLPSDWAKVISDYLRIIGWPGNRELSSIEYQTLEIWTELLAELAGLDSVCGMIRFKAAIGRLGRIASARLFQPKSEPAPVQIMGVYEASGLCFDRLWIMGMHDNAWPTASAFYPFVPLRLQRRLALQHSSPGLQLEYTKTLTTRLLSSAPTIVVSYPKRDCDVDVKVSPFFSGLPESSGDELGIPAAKSYVEQLCGSSRMELLDDSYGPPCGDIVNKGGTALFKLQAACPFKAFAELRLEAIALDLPEPGLSAIDRGTLVHSILQQVWKQLRSHHVLQSMSDDRLTEVVESSVVTEIQKFSAHRRTLRSPRCAEIERGRLNRIVRKWLAREKERKPFTMLEQEEKLRVSVGGHEMNIRIDRIDRMENGDLAIIDYKTGDCSISDWDGDRPDEPQLPIYAVAANAPLAGVFFGCLKAGKIGFKGKAFAPGIVPGVNWKKSQPPLSHCIGEWRDALDRLGNDFSAGHAIVDPKKQKATCKYCALSALCRISQASIKSERGDA